MISRSLTNRRRTLWISSGDSEPHRGTRCRPLPRGQFGNRIVTPHAGKDTRMPFDLECAQCLWKASVGAYHGFEGGKWYVDLYCRGCGARHVFESSTLSRGRSGEPSPHLLNGVPIPATEPGEAQLISCSCCGTSGPIGDNGPITGEPPTLCPRCRTPSVRIVDEWIT